MNNIQNKQMIKEMSQTKYPKKNEEKIHCLQGANPVYQRGKGPPGGTLAFFFLAFCDVMGNQSTAQKKTTQL